MKLRPNSPNRLYDWYDKETGQLAHPMLTYADARFIFGDDITRMEHRPS